jgi:hypothetical protein
MKDPLVRMAEQIRRGLARADSESDQLLALHIENSLAAHRAVEAGWRRIEKARRHAWAAAALRARDELTRLIHQTHAAAALLASRESQLFRTPTDPPTLRTLHEELQQLFDEFEHVELDAKGGRIVAHTPPVVLEGLSLGPFAIELHVRSLDRLRADGGSFEVVALEPRPAAGNHDVTHPHVSGRSLCAGDAAAPISQALRQGRIADAFCLVRSVLNTYNSGSPYVSIDDWEGVRCQDCGDSVHGDDLFSCQVCDGQYCGHCTSCCELCDRSACHGCLERDPVTRRDCCPNCRSACSECGRVVQDDEFHQETNLCPECHQKRSNETNPPDAEDLTHECEAQ